MDDDRPDWLDALTMALVVGAIALLVVCILAALLARPAAAQTLQRVSPQTWAWSPAEGGPDGYDVLVDRGDGYEVETRVVDPSVTLGGLPGETIRLKVRGVRGTEIGPESPESDPLTWVAPEVSCGDPGLASMIPLGALGALFVRRRRIA